MFWVDAWTKKLFSASVHGDRGGGGGATWDVREEASLAQQVADNPTFGLVMIEGTALIGVWGTGQVSAQFVRRNFFLQRFGDRCLCVIY